MLIDIKTYVSDNFKCPKCGHDEFYHDRIDPGPTLTRIALTATGISICRKCSSTFYERYTIDEVEFVEDEDWSG